MVGLISIIIITVISFAMMMEGWKKYDSQKFYTGLLVIGISIIMIFPVMQYNSVRHSWIKAGPGTQRCAICGITKRSEYIDGKTVHCVYLSSGELYSMTGETPECRDLSEFY